MSSSLLRSQRGHSRAVWTSWNNSRRNVLVGEIFKAAAASEIQTRWFTSSVVRSSYSPIRTLIPEKLSAARQEVYDLSDKPRVILPRLSKPHFSLAMTYAARTPFPPKTKGVFYYHQPPDLPPLAGELRFRLCNSIAKFPTGKDLKIDVGQYWRVPLQTIVKSSKYSDLRALLVKEELVDGQVVADLESLPGKFTHGTALSLFNIDQPFVLDLSWVHVQFRFVTRHSMQSVAIQLFSPPFSYQGRLMARFEILQPEPDSDMKGPAVVLRFLKALTPIKPLLSKDKCTIAKPSPGQLWTKLYKTGRKTPWSIPLDPEVAFGRVIKKFLEERESDRIKYGV